MVGTQLAGTDLVGTQMTLHRIGRHTNGGTEMAAPKWRHRNDIDPFDVVG